VWENEEKHFLTQTLNEYVCVCGTFERFAAKRAPSVHQTVGWMDWRLSGRGSEEQNPCPSSESKPGRPTPFLVIKQSELHTSHLALLYSVMFSLSFPPKNSTRCLQDLTHLFAQSV